MVRDHEAAGSSPVTSTNIARHDFGERFLYTKSALLHVRLALNRLHVIVCIFNRSVKARIVVITIDTRILKNDRVRYYKIQEFCSLTISKIEYRCLR